MLLTLIALLRLSFSAQAYVGNPDGYAERSAEHRIADTAADSARNAVRQPLRPSRLYADGGHGASAFGLSGSGDARGDNDRRGRP